MSIVLSRAVSIQQLSLSLDTATPTVLKRFAALVGSDLYVSKMQSNDSIEANVLWATDWPDEQETPRAILRIILENGGEPHNDVKAWNQLSDLVANDPIRASCLISCFVRTVLRAQSHSTPLQALESATQAAERAPNDAALRSVLHKRVLLCYRIAFEYHRKMSRYLLSTSADRRALINKIQEHVARLAPFILCAGQTSYDLASALKHRPAVLLPAITAINACPASIAETGGVLQAKLRTGFPFLDNNGSELDILRETVFQLIMAILNFNIHSDLLPHKDRKPDGVLFQESCRLQQALLKRAPAIAAGTKRSRKPRKSIHQRLVAEECDANALLRSLAAQAISLQEKIVADLKKSDNKQTSAIKFNEAMKGFYASKDRLTCLRNLRSSFLDAIVKPFKVPMVIENRRLSFCLQQADRLDNILNDDKESSDGHLIGEIAATIFCTIQRLVCSTRVPSDPSAAARAIYERVQAAKRQIQAFKLARPQIKAFNDFMNQVYKDPKTLNAVVSATNSLLQSSPVTERTRSIRQAYKTAIRVLQADIPQFRLQHPDQIHHRDIQYAKNITMEVLKKCQLLLE